MSLKNLAQRYEERVNELYAGATLKFEDGKPSREFNVDPLNVRQVGNESFGPASRILGRSLPVARAAQDTLRLGKFLASGRGATFLAKQYLLQTGNTFEITRLLNPLFVLGATAAPGLGNVVRIRRHLNPRGTLLSRTETKYINAAKENDKQELPRTSIRNLGQLQVTTYNKEFLNPTTNQFALGNLKPASPRNAKVSVGEVQKWLTSRPELKTLALYAAVIHNTPGSVNFKYGGLVTKQNNYGPQAPLVGRTTDNVFKYLSPAASIDSKFSIPARDYSIGAATKPWENNTAIATTTRTSELNPDRISAESSPRWNPVVYKTLTELQNDSAFQAQKTLYQVPDGQQLKFIQYFTPGRESIKNRSDSTDPRRPDARTPISYIKDDSNAPAIEQISRLTRYNALPKEIDDPITVSFAMGANEAVPFRAFIKDLNQTITPEYKVNQYIGRTEKFVNYVSVQRELSFKLGVIAFGQSELETVWTRINYLTGMAFPYGLSRGIFQPNIIRLTIGKLFDDQYGYITSLNTNFTDISETWDIDKEIPIGATMDIKFTIIEKQAMTANSAFYAINERAGAANGFAEAEGRRTRARQALDTALASATASLDAMAAIRLVGLSTDAERTEFTRQALRRATMRSDELQRAAEQERQLENLERNGPGSAPGG